MNVRLTWRLILFGLAIPSLALLMGWRGFLAWQETDHLRQQFQELSQDTHRAAEGYRAVMLDANQTLLRFDLYGTASERARLQEKLAAMEEWIRREGPGFRTPEDQSVLLRIRQAFADYREQAEAFLGERDAAATPLTRTPTFQRLETLSSDLLSLSVDLDSSHRQLTASYLEEANRSAQRLHWFTVGAVAALLLLLGLSAWRVWLDLVAPLQARLLHSNRLLEQQEKLSALGELAAGVAHEIRNPLTSLKARAFTLERLLKSPSPEHEDAGVIKQEVQRLERIVDEFLQFARPGDPVKRTVPVLRLFEETARLLRPDMEKRSVTLAIAPSDDLNVCADPAQMKQVLINLIRNAAEATGAGGRIELRAFLRGLKSGQTGASFLCMEVRDNGPGIPPAAQKRLFDPFFSTKPAGTGLGLSIAARILGKHGGSLEYQTAPGSGTAFRLLLPTTT